MKSAGIDIGSRTIKLVVLDNGKLIFSRKAETSFEPATVCENLLRAVQYDRIMATGYGRHLFKERFGGDVITEIKAAALGTRSLVPGCRTILDIGGQDSKAIALDSSGKILKFEMNDKCAAGTGRFLEIMAIALGFSLDEFGKAALATEQSASMNSMCTVFAESEVISMVARGASRMEVARGLHEAVVRRSSSMMKHNSIEEDIVFVGGVALNPAIHKLLGLSLGKAIHIVPDPQIVCALGAALS